MEKKAIINITNDQRHSAEEYEFTLEKASTCLEYCKANNLQVINKYEFCENSQMMVFWDNPFHAPEIIRDYSNRGLITDLVIYYPLDLAFQKEKLPWIFDALSYSKVNIHIVRDKQTINGEVVGLLAELNKVVTNT